jgi:hypothetical protein
MDPKSNDGATPFWSAAPGAGIAAGRGGEAVETVGRAERAVDRFGRPERRDRLSGNRRVENVGKAAAAAIQRDATRLMAISRRDGCKRAWKRRRSDGYKTETEKTEGGVCCPSFSSCWLGAMIVLAGGPQLSTRIEAIAQNSL